MFYSQDLKLFIHLIFSCISYIILVKDLMIKKFLYYSKWIPENLTRSNFQVFILLH